MSKRFWCSDIHFSHGNICKYCGRPWLRKEDLDENGDWISETAALDCAERMNAGLIKNINSKVKKDDRVICVGDFANYGKARGFSGLKYKSEELLKQLNGIWTLLRGNHCDNNHVKTVAKYMIVDIGPYQAFICHQPTDNEIHDPVLIDWVYRSCAFAIVGHVHNKWKYSWVGFNKGYDFLNINVSVEMHKYAPIDDSDVIGIYEKCNRERKEKFANI